MDCSVFPIDLERWPVWLAPLAEGGADRIIAFCILRDMSCPSKSELEQQLEQARQQVAS